MASPNHLFRAGYRSGQTRPDTRIAEASGIDLFRLEAEISRSNVIHWKDTGEEENWTHVERLADGPQGCVLLQRKVQTAELRIVKKVVPDTSRPGTGQQYIPRELYHMITLIDRPDLFVQFTGWYENKARSVLYLVMEYLELGDLKRYISEFGPQEEGKSKRITKQLLEALAVLHQRRICHRDLKPENILIASLSPIRVKIADFGVSKCTIGTDLRTQCGSHGYIAPELQGFRPRRNDLPGNEYSPAVDIWALGCLVHEILTSEVPFSGVIEATLSEISYLDWVPQPSFDTERFSGYCAGNISFPVESLRNSQVSGIGEDFIKSLLTVNPNYRPSASEVLNHVWLSRV